LLYIPDRALFLLADPFALYDLEHFSGSAPALSCFEYQSVQFACDYWKQPLLQALQVCLHDAKMCV